MNRIYLYKYYKLHVSDTRVTIETMDGFFRGTYYFTARMKGETKQSVIRFLKRIKAL